MPHIENWDVNTPPDSEGIALWASRLRETKRALEERLDDVLDWTADPVTLLSNFSIPDASVTLGKLAAELRALILTPVTVSADLVLNIPANTAHRGTIALAGVKVGDAATPPDHVVLVPPAVIFEVPIPPPPPLPAPIVWSDWLRMSARVTADGIVAFRIFNHHPTNTFSAGGGGTDLWWFIGYKKGI